MKAWVKRDGRLQLTEIPDPTLGNDELLVRVEAVSLNRGEVRTARAAAEGVTPGWDVAGTVVKGPNEGARVAAIVNNGAWAELVRVPAVRAGVIPDGVDLEVAATTPIAGLTAMRAFAVAGSMIGRDVLITGGSGGVGQFAIQLGAIGGANVTTISSREEQHDALRKLGARSVVAKIEDAKGPFDFILDSVGGSSFAKAIELVAREGTIVTIGNSAEEPTTFNVRTLYAKGAATIYGLIIFEEMEHRRVTGRDLERLLGLIREGRVEAPVDVRRSWTELPQVLDDLENRRYTGKAVLTL